MRFKQIQNLVFT